MITVLYCNINKIPDDKIASYLQVLPEFMKADVMRYINSSDQKSRLIARLMLQRSMEKTGAIGLIDKWKRDQNNKPFIDGWDSFNISHSGELVVFAYGSNKIGIDIEKKVEFNYKEIMEYFHPEERRYINNAENIQKAFYDIWVKKEALLKALGIGIIKGLNEFNCSDESINHEGKDWYFNSFFIHPDYSFYICTLHNNHKIFAKEFTPVIYKIS